MRKLGRHLGRTALVGVVLLLVIGAGLVAMVAADRANAKQEAIHRGDRLQLASSLATLADGYFLQLVQAQTAVASAIPTGLLSSPDAGPDLARATADLPGAALPVVIGPTGAPAVTAPNAGPLAAILPELAPALDAALAARSPAISRVISVAGHARVAVAVPVGPGGAALVVAYRLDYLPLAAYVQQLQIGQEAVSYIVDQSDRLVTSPRPSGIGSGAGGRLAAAITSTRSAAVVQTRGSVPDVVAVVPLAFSGWHLVIVQPAPVFYGALWHATTTFRWALLALLIVVAGALLTFHARRQSALQAIAEMAVKDALTGLPNRLAFSRSLEAAMGRHRRSGGDVGLLFCDLDGFKAVNDQLGHDAGDELLVAAAERLRKCVRTSSDATATLARLGGDEFTVLLEGRQVRNDAGPLATAVTDAFDEPFVLGPYELSVGVSVGVAFAHPDRDLLRDADVAMYRAKAVRKAAREADSPDRFTGAPIDNLKVV